jgi:hypothetical protein
VNYPVCRRTRKGKPGSRFFNTIHVDDLDVEVGGAFYMRKAAKRLSEEELEKSGSLV